MPRFTVAVVTSAALFCLTTAQAEDRPWKYTVGADYSTGDYGGDPVDTDILFLPVSASYSTGKWTYKASSALVSIDGPGNVIGAGGDGIVVDGGNTRATTETGLGDTWLGASYEVGAVPAEWFYLDAGAKIKIPTADDNKRLGTGEVDYSFSADVYKPYGQYTPFANLTYKIKGDPPQGSLDNVLALSVGSDYRYSDQRNFGASLDYQQSATASDDSLELFAYVNHRLSDQYSVMFYNYLGLMDGSPDYGLGIQFSYRP